MAQIYFDEWNEIRYRVRVGYFRTFEETHLVAQKLR